MACPVCFLAGSEGGDCAAIGHLAAMRVVLVLSPRGAQPDDPAGDKPRLHPGRCPLAAAAQIASGQVVGRDQDQLDLSFGCSGPFSQVSRGQRHYGGLRGRQTIGGEPKTKNSKME